MKKLIAILCAAAVLATSLFGALVFTAVAEETVTPVAETGDDIKLAYWEDEFGNEIQLWPGSLIGVPSNITSDNFSLVKNTTKLPLTSLFSYSIPEGKTSAGPSLKMSETIDPSAVKGAIFYVEIPDFGTVSHTYDMGTSDDTSDDQTRSSNLFRLALSFTGYDYQRDSSTGAYLYNADGSIKTSSKTYLTYGSPDWYICEAGSDKWKASGTKTYYGVGLHSGWKGYVCIPFASLNQTNYNVTADSRITGVNIRQLRSTTDVFRVEHNTNNPEYGYLPEDKALVISEPLWMLGNYTEGANEFYQKDSFCIDGVSYNHITGKAADFSNNSTKFNIAKAFKTYESTTEAIEGGTYGYRNIVTSTSILTSNKGLWTTAVRTYDENNPGKDSPARGHWPEGTLFSELTSSTGSGFLFHISMPKQDEGIVNRFTLNIYGTKSNGAGPEDRSLDIAVEGTQVVYLLKDGATAWETRTEGVAGDWYNNYYPVLNDGSEPWSGYVFVPKGCMNDYDNSIYYLQEVRISTRNNRYSNKSPNTQEKTLGVSAVSMVSGFDPTSTIMYGDDNRIVDLAKDEILDLDYFAAKEFVGKEGLLPEIPTNVIRADVMPLREFALAGNAVGSNVFTGGTIATGATYVPSASPINKMPLFSVSGTVANSATSQGVQFDVSNNKVSEATIIRCDDVDGFMFYVKNTDTAVPIRFGAAIMTSSDGVTYTTKYSIYNDNPTYLLAKDSDKWTTAGNEGLGGMKIIPANFEGWVYIPKFDTLKKQYTLCWRFNIYMGTTSANKQVDFDFGSFMTVRAGTFTTENAGYALVNDAVAVQDMWSGDFAVINDYNKDMRVNLLALLARISMQMRIPKRHLRIVILQIILQTLTLKRVLTKPLR